MLADRSYLRGYALAFLLVMLALGFRFAMDPVLGEQLPYHAFYFAIAIAAAWGGLGPGLVALVIAFVGGNYFFAHPRYSFELFSHENILSTVRFLSIGGLVAVLGNWGRSRVRIGQLHLAAKERDLDLTRQEKERTQSMLASIGDGLITVDTRGHVTFMNATASELCGWAADTAKGIHLDLVLPLVERDTRAVVPNPALRALELGTTVLLPENVALIARDGTERLIDDSAAPIHDGKGQITGSVIIFRDVTGRSVLERAERRTSFTLANIHLAPANEAQLRLSPEEREQLERACREWITREWVQSEKAVRLVALSGFNLIIRQERTEERSAGQLAVHFTVAYERALV